MSFGGLCFILEKKILFDVKTFLKWVFIVIPFSLYLSLRAIKLATYSDKEGFKKNMPKSEVKKGKNYRAEPII